MHENGEPKVARVALVAHPALHPSHAGDDVFTDAARRIYIELMDCLQANEPWTRRWG